MTPDDLLRQRQHDWEALSRLVERSRRNVRHLTPNDVAQLSQLYRNAASDLALAQRDFPDHQLTRYLNQLVAGAHATMYQHEPLSLLRLRRFVTTGFPRTFREALPFFVAAALLFIIPGLLVGFVTSWNPDASKALLPPNVQQLLPLLERKELWTAIPVEERPYASAFIMRNNVQVMFLAFSGGVLLGLLTLYVMIMNGLIIGGLTGLTIHYGVGFELWTFVIGHGVIELTVIFMAGGAGLMLGWAILHPGLLRRRDALRIAAGRAVRLVFGAIPLLVVAGLIEGFISPNETIPVVVKWVVGLTTGFLLYTYLLRSGRSQARS
jgi:uncharacterized membrane protein SpoIIM required for sporulation